jgi:2-oxo-3-hexenedioate decarboxylase
MTILDLDALADELAAAYATGTVLATPPSARDADFDLAAAYAVESKLTARRRAAGRRTVGRKVGFANKAMWRILKLDTLVWAHMYDDTVREVPSSSSTHPVAERIAPRIEPEIVFKLKTAVPAGSADAAAVLANVEWMALGFEINDCVFPAWKFTPADFVAAYGLHRALLVGAPHALVAEEIPALVDALAGFKLRLLKNDELVEEGSGRASLRSPALCLGELASAIAKVPGAEPLAAGEIVSTGTLTSAQPIAPGERWHAAVEGLPLPALTIHVI